jgi:hypothetical protein
LSTLAKVANNFCLFFSYKNVECYKITRRAKMHPIWSPCCAETAAWTKVEIFLETAAHSDADMGRFDVDLKTYVCS